MKIWRSFEKGDDVIIAFVNNTIYRGNPKAADIENIISNLQMQVIPTKNFIGIPLAYLKQINLEDGNKNIDVLFGNDSTEHLKISDPEKRNEIFNYFREHIPNSSFHIDKYSKIRAGKKPLIAMCVVTGLFLWTYYIANGMEQGNEYDVSGKQYHSVAGIVLLFASIGKTNVALVCGTLFAIAAISFLQKTKHPKVINVIQLRR